MIYGYARVSTAKQNIERQIRNILELYPSAKIYQDKYSGRKRCNLYNLNRLLDAVKPGDTIVFDQVSRMSRSAEEGTELYFRLYEQGVNLVFLKDAAINTDVYKAAVSRQIAIEADSGKESVNNLLDGLQNVLNRFFMDLATDQIRAAFAASQSEVDQLSIRTKEGLKTARNNGKQIGCVKGAVYNVKKKDAAKAKIRRLSRWFDGSLSDEECMRVVNLSRNTYYKYKGELNNELKGVYLHETERSKEGI